MSILSELSPARGAYQSKKRLGRGRGSGLGQTSGKGHKGQLARTGGRVRRGFEGGQTPLVRRLPKVGFSNLPFRKEYSIVNVGVLERFEGRVTPELLQEAGLVKRLPVKILGGCFGKPGLSKALTVVAHSFSEAAKKAIESVGGQVEVVKG